MPLGRIAGFNPYPEIAKVRVEIFLERYLLHFFFAEVVAARVEPALLEAAMSAPDDTRTADAERLGPLYRP